MKKSCIFYYQTIFPFLLVLIVSSNFFPKKVIATETIKNTLSEKSLESKCTFKDYEIKIYRELFSLLVISKKRVVVHSSEGFKFDVIDGNSLKAENSMIAVGSDITGDGDPNLIIREWTGGVHCCFIYHIFILEPTFRYIQGIELKHGGGDGFINLDDDPALELVIVDWTFAYWNSSFNTSPAPKVILKYNGSIYEISHELMRKPFKNGNYLVDKSKLIRAYKFWGEHNIPPYQLWTFMLDLIYSGNMKKAIELLNLSWPKKIGGKDKFLTDFMNELATSPYWEDLKILNKLK